jgi:hypothetical protein
MRVDLVAENPESHKSGFWATIMPVIVEYERRVAIDRHDCYWLYVVTGCKSEPILQEPIKNPARWTI